MARDVDNDLQREVKATLKVAGHILRGHGKKLAGEDRQKIRSALDELARARDSRDPTLARLALDEVERLYQLHLHRYRKSTLREYVESIGWAVAVALLLRSFVVEAYKIPSGSMIPTLLVGDHIFVNKFIYGFQIPFTVTKFLQFSSPARGDVIVFKKPDELDKDFIKRVVGTGGDTVELKGGELYVNGAIQPREARGVYLNREFDELGGAYTEVLSQRFVETLGKTAHDVLIQNTWNTSHNRVYTVREGHVFVMGDNRDNSLDSRVWGLVPLDHVKGKAMFIWASFGGKDGFRFSRLFTWIR